MVIELSDGAPGPEAARRPGLSPARRRRLLIGAAVVAALVLTAVIFFRWGSGRDAAPLAAAPAPSPSATALTVPQVYETLLPSVVFIRSTGGGETATGTGVVVNADGGVLTALHVVAGAKAIEVTFADGTRSAATVAADDPGNDIATLTVTELPSVVVPAVLGGGAAVGDDVVAIGNQLGLRNSTTTGIVSGLDRSVGQGAQAGLKGLIQFDAAVNPGSSGGPLLNTRGQVVGVIVALANPTAAGTFVGVGFAVPIGTAVGGDGPGDGPALPL